MAFSSVQFLFVFLPLSLAVYWLCPKWLRNAVLALGDVLPDAVKE
jgi:alginate O-acetyltransferase complex protein AlgI